MMLILILDGLFLKEKGKKINETNQKVLFSNFKRIY